MSSSSNRPATPSDAPPAATPEGLTNWLLLAMNEAFEMRASKRASVILRAIDAAGYAVVPKEPTRAMHDASDEILSGPSWTGVVPPDCRFDDYVRKLEWAAMLAAAPRP